MMAVLIHSFSQVRHNRHHPSSEKIFFGSMIAMIGVMEKDRTHLTGIELNRNDTIEVRVRDCSG